MILLIILKNYLKFSRKEKWGLGIGDWGLGFLGLGQNPKTKNQKTKTQNP